MNDIFCTYFDHNYLSRAMLTIRSLRRYEPHTSIYVLALSELCEAILRELALANVEIIPLGVLEKEYPELGSLKLTQAVVEFGDGWFTASYVDVPPDQIKSANASSILDGARDATIKWLVSRNDKSQLRSERRLIMSGYPARDVVVLNSDVEALSGRTGVNRSSITAGS